MYAMSTLSMACMVEPVLWFLALYSYSRFTSKGNVFSFRLYLTVQLAISALSVPVLFMALSSDGPAGTLVLAQYTRIFWLGGILSGLLAIVVIRAILKGVLGSLVGLQRVSLVAFQWVVVLGFFVTLDRVIAGAGTLPLSSELQIVFIGICITQLVLLLLVVPFTFLVRRSLRSCYQDVMMGLAILAVSNSVLGLTLHLDAGFASGAFAVTDHIVLVTTLIFWVCCFVTEEKMERPRLLPINSKLVRWNERLRVLQRISAPSERS